MASPNRSSAPVQTPGAAEGHPSVLAGDLPGDQPCTQPGCGALTGVACEYMDRRGHGCRTAWCPDHRLVIDTRVYCRRHAGVVSALPVGYVGHTAPMPDLETRAPSLVSWVAREVDADIRQLLLAEAGEGAVQLVTDPVYLVFVGSDRRRAWERAWKLVDHTGRSLRVSLLVEEGADAELAVRVDTTVVGRLAPPWIVQRLHGALPPPEVDSDRRRDFNRRLLGIIDKGVRRRTEREAIGVGVGDSAAEPAGRDR
ncbi:MAG: hypothetical protein ACLQT7_02305 [Candidatus Dormibacteria bacterium]